MARLHTIALLAALLPGWAGAAPDPVVIDGVVPNEETRQALLAKLREVYGADRIVDQMGVGQRAVPPNWAAHVQKLISTDLQRVSRGELKIAGNVIELSGEVDSEATRQQILSRMTAALNPTYSVRDHLRIGAGNQQALDAAMANRTIEFEPGNATLTANGVAVLEALLPVLQQLKTHRFDVIGHTDALGGRLQNIALSAARADAVKAYLVAKGIPAANLQTSGLGPDRPVAGNDTPEGRARNRRIELRVVQ